MGTNTVNLSSYLHLISKICVSMSMDVCVINFALFFLIAEVFFCFFYINIVIFSMETFGSLFLH